MQIKGTQRLDIRPKRAPKSVKAMTKKTTLTIRVDNRGHDTSEKCPAFNTSTRYTPNGPKKRSDTFFDDIKNYAPKVVNKMHSILIEMGKRSH